ncbi:MAG: hypothetical protein NZ933_00805, partial [Bacteroidia bacterium]|nr:hypothetical protein [Bacteroidia bacterium]
MQNPHRHWYRWPFSLEGRFYCWQGKVWMDSLGLTWIRGRQHEDIPTSWLERLATSRIGFDIGAHRGYWSLVQRSFMPHSTQVILMEPDPENYAYLLRNLALNQAFWAIPLPLAAWHSPAHLSLQSRSFHQVHASFM